MHNIDTHIEHQYIIRRSSFTKEPRLECEPRFSTTFVETFHVM
jgi:hypothetical protein